MPESPDWGFNMLTVVGALQWSAHSRRKEFAGEKNYK